MLKFSFLALLILVPEFALAQTITRGYVRSNGTYVAPYVRSSPDSTRSNNYNTDYNSGSVYVPPTSPTTYDTYRPSKRVRDAYAKPAGYGR